MVIDDFPYMDRMSSDHKAITRFLLNVKIERNGRMTKLLGYETSSIDNNDINGGGSLAFGQNGIFYKHPEHPTASTIPTVFIIHNNELYYWGGSDWVQVTWEGNLGKGLENPRFWASREKLFIAGGTSGREAVYEYLDRQIADGNGYFNDNEEYNDFYFAPGLFPQFDMRFAFRSFDILNHATFVVEPTKAHYVMGVYNFNGQEGIYKPSSYKILTTGGETDTTTVWQVEFGVAFDAKNNFDKRVTAIDLYMGIDRYALAQTPTIDTDLDIDQQDENRIQWKFWRRISINKDTTWIETPSDDALASSGVTVGIVQPGTGELAWLDAFAFGANTLTDFYLAKRSTGSDTWTYSKIASNTTITITVTDADFFVTGNRYFVKVVSRWELVSGSTYKMNVLLLGDDSLGDPYDTVQAYNISGEYYPQAEFTAIQDRRTYRLGPTTDEEHKNILMWSEPDKPQVNPNRNLVILKTHPNEDPKGLVEISNGLLAFYEKSVHRIRMTGEPVIYDAEEGKADVGCIAKHSIVEENGRVYWFGNDGIKMFDGQIHEVADPIRDDYFRLIANELLQWESYDRIVGGYSRAMRMIVWHFGGSFGNNLEIEGESVDGLGYDIDKGGFTFLNTTFFYYLLSDYDGILYSPTAANEIVQVFGGAPDENNKMVYESGQITQGFDRTRADKIKIRNKGTFDIKIYGDKKSTAIVNEPYGTTTTLNHDVRVGLDVDEFKIRAESEMNKLDAEFTRIAIRSEQLKR